MTFNYKLSDNTWDIKEINAILRVLDSNQFTMGIEVREFEKKFSAYFGSKYAVMVNSGSSANLLATAALIYSEKLRKGDEVIVPAVSWSTTYFPISQHGLKLRFVDIDRETLNINLDLIEYAITEHTKAVLVVNLLGNSNEYDKLLKICEKHNLILIEDNCEALGAKYKHKYCGTFGLLGTFSTFFSHHICTMEGGVVVTNSVELYHYMLAIRAHGWTRNLPKNSKLIKKSENSFYEAFNFIIPGYNLRPLEISAAIGLEQIKKIENIISNRRKNAEIFKDLFYSNPNIIIQKEIGESSWFGFAIILTNELEGKRDIIVEKMKKNGIEVRPIVAGNFTKNKVIEYLDYSISNNLNNADYIHNNGFFVGNHSELIKKELFLLSKLLYDD